MQSGLSAPPLFTPGDATSQAFKNLRDAPLEEGGGRALVERLWQQYFEYADAHFRDEIRRDFHARFWEMYLTCTLLDAAPRHGYHLQCPKPGPDILLEHKGQRIWIEAVTATPGDPLKPDSLQPHIDGQMSLVPADKLVLRYANTIAAKYEKFRNYQAQGVVAEGDAWVIAINGWPLDYSWASGEMPRFLKALYPLGALGYAIDPATRDLVDRRHQFRPTIHKVNRAPVSTEVFVSSDTRSLSAVLHSYAHAFMDLPLGADFELAHHPLAAQTLPADLIPAARQWRARQTAEGCFELVSNQALTIDGPDEGTGAAGGIR